MAQHTILRNLLQKQKKNGKLKKDFSGRMRRSLSWLERSEKKKTDIDSKFIFNWISFNAAYARDKPEADSQSAYLSFKEYFGILLPLDTNEDIYAILEDEIEKTIFPYLQNKFTKGSFWEAIRNERHGIPYDADWKKRFSADKRKFRQAIKERDAQEILLILFPRLYVLRNQLIHGGATWSGETNREQVKNGAKILMRLVPIFLRIMIENPNEDWGALQNPRIETY